jgi:hypothetical protein
MHEEVMERSDTAVPESPREGEPPTREQVADEMRAEVQQWAEVIAARNYDAGGLLVRARDTKEGEMIALGCLGRRRTQTRMLIKLLEQLPHEVSRMAMAYTVAGPVEKALMDMLLDIGSTEGGYGGTAGGKTNAEAMQKQQAKGDVTVKDGETLEEAQQRVDAEVKSEA